MERLARAKINLALHVTGQRDDGYHLIDSLVTFANFGDEVSVSPAAELTLSIDGPFAHELDASENNLVLKAARLLLGLKGGAKFGAAIHLTKNLPVASGVGGGSADAAAALSALIDLWGISLDDDELHALALQLGADVPMCLAGKPCTARGIGEELHPVSLPSMNIVMVNPLVSVSTPTVFNALSQKNNPPLEDVKHIADVESCVDYLKRQRNDLLLPSLSLTPEIGEALNALTKSGADFVSMSGSGATCFGVYSGTHEEAEKAAFNIQSQHPTWWVQSTTTAE